MDGNLPVSVTCHLRAKDTLFARDDQTSPKSLNPRNRGPNCQRMNMLRALIR